jgi:phenylpropionate dioxygenase-like ring-hydroxylating dioxygenase large terminal subunit
VNSMPDDRSLPAPSSEEVSLALRRCWQPVARVQDLEHGPQRSVLLGEALAVFVTENGEPAVVADRCAHRGASLSMGEVRGEAIQCPYHGWEWGGRDGACTRIPSLADQAQIPPGARIPPFPAREQWGLVWTVLEAPLGEPPTVPWFDEQEWRWGHGEPFELPVSFGIVIENFRDFAHFSFVHKQTLGVTEEVVEPLEPKRKGLEVFLRRNLTVSGEARSVWSPTFELRNHVIAPNFTSAHMRTPKGERCLLQVSRAMSARESMTYWIQGLARDFDGDLDEAIDFEKRVYAEDCAIISRIEPPELPLHRRADVSTLSDRFGLAYREAFAEFVRRAIRKHPPQDNSATN